MKKLSGIRTVDFTIIAKGHGAVNWNGSLPFRNPDKDTKTEDGKPWDVNNHSIPKLRSYSNYTGEITEKGHKVKRFPTDFNPAKHTLYISENCIRHHLFRDQAFDSYFATKSTAPQLLCSETGMLRGYAIARDSLARTGPLYITPFYDTLGNGNFEQMTRCGSKEKVANKKGVDSSNSLFSKITFGDTLYHSRGSISIEGLQFISLDKKFTEQSVEITEKNVDKLIIELEAFFHTLNQDLNPKVTYSPNFVRGGTIFNQSQAGLLLNDDAIQIMVDEMLRRIKELYIKQAQGYMYVDSIQVDYNNSSKAYRIIRSPEETSEHRSENFTQYYAEG